MNDNWLHSQIQIFFFFFLGGGGGVGGGGGWLSSTYFTDGRTDFPREAIGPIASRGVSVPVFLKRPIAISDFLIFPRADTDQLLPSGSAHE